MGLDMYLTERHSKVLGPREEEQLKRQKLAEIMNIELDSESLVELEMHREVGYWRKANAIHKWFVNNVQDGEDDCNRYEVSVKQLLQLRDLCEQVVENNNLAMELLPPTQGFFFGSTDLDEYYYQDLDYTIEMLDRVLGEISWETLKDKYSDRLFYYQSSW